MKKVLTIAGSDCSGGAGIQADLKTIIVHRCYAMSVITALTVQNTTGVFGVETVSPAFISAQIDAVFSDIRPDAVKIGMVSNVDAILAIADRLRYWKAENIVLDPVMISTSGSRLLDQGAITALINKLFPLARVITPNIPETQALSGHVITCKQEMEEAAHQISRLTNGGVLIKGGHLSDTADDLLLDNEQIFWFSAPRVDSKNTHGTGCTLSSAIACGLAQGLSLQKSISAAKQYLTGALKAGLDLGNGSGPLDHGYRIKQEENR